MRHLDWLQAQRPHRQLFSQRLIISKIRRVGGLVMATWIVCHLTPARLVLDSRNPWRRDAADLPPKMIDADDE
jgi:hypothetical protein